MIFHVFCSIKNDFFVSEFYIFLDFSISFCFCQFWKENNMFDFFQKHIWKAIIKSIRMVLPSSKYLNYRESYDNLKMTCGKKYTHLIFSSWFILVHKYFRKRRYMIWSRLLNMSLNGSCFIILCWYLFAFTKVDFHTYMRSMYGRKIMTFSGKNNYYEIWIFYKQYVVCSVFQSTRRGVFHNVSSMD